MIVFIIPVKTVSEINKTSEHWSAKHRRHKAQRLHTWNAFRQAVKVPLILPCVITMTRIAPRRLDDDNLRTALKTIRDQLAAMIVDDYRPGRADSDDRIKWQYAQEKGKPKEYTVKIQIVMV